MPHATEMLQIALKALQLALEALQITRVTVANDPLSWLINVAIIYVYSYQYYLQNYRVFHSLLHISTIVLTTTIFFTVAGAKGMLIAWAVAALCDFNEEF